MEKEQLRANYFMSINTIGDVLMNLANLRNRLRQIYSTKEVLEKLKDWEFETAIHLCSSFSKILMQVNKICEKNLDKELENKLE